jgi:hypothetical protein
MALSTIQKLYRIETQIKTLPIVYTLNQWNNLTAYTQDGHLNIDNNRAERGIKPFVIDAKTGCSARPPTGQVHQQYCTPLSK